MPHENDNSDEILIKIPRSAWDKSASQENQSTPKIVDSFELFSRTGVQVISGKRNSEHGATQIQTLAIPNKEQKDKVIRLLDNPVLFARLPKLLSYLYSLGRGGDGEVRFFAAMAVVTLADHFPFVDLKDAVISPWARDAQGSVNRLAALTLVNLLQKDVHKNDVLNLLKHWIHINNLDLVNTALTAYFAIAKQYPREALEAIKLILLEQHAIILIPQALTMLEWLYLHEPVRVVNTFYDWLSSSKNDAFLLFTASTFLSVVEIKDIAGDNLARSHAVEFVFRLWEDTKLPLHLNLQEMATEAIADWAKDTLRMTDGSTEKEACRQFFHELFAKCATARNNRLVLHLQRWQKIEQLKNSRDVRWQKAEATEHYDFLSLIS